MRSCDVRARRRTRRPKNNTGATNNGTHNKTIPVRRGSVKYIKPMPPKKISTFRNATETEEPITDRIKVVSVVRRV